MNHVHPGAVTETGDAVIRYSEADVPTEYGEFRVVVYREGDGGEAVASRAGEVMLKSSGGEVTVAAGEQAEVADDAEPEKSTVPESVYLKVRWPEERMTRETVASVRGEADPTSQVEVNGQVVAVAADGNVGIVLDAVDPVSGVQRVYVQGRVVANRGPMKPLSSGEARDTLTRGWPR